MGKTVRSWQKRPGWQETRRDAKRKERRGEKKDRFRFDPREYR